MRVTTFLVLLLPLGACDVLPQPPVGPAIETPLAPAERVAVPEIDPSDPLNPADPETPINVEDPESPVVTEPPPPPTTCPVNPADPEHPINPADPEAAC